MNELNWSVPDMNLTYNQTLIYRATSKYGTYSLIATLTDIRVTNYVDLNGVSTSWYKIRFYDSTNNKYSSYSQPMPSSGTVSNTNYTTPKMVAFHLNNYTQVVAEAIGTGDATATSFGPTLEKYPIEDTETVYVGGTAKQRNVDYTMDYDKGLLIFASAPALSAAITIDYWANAYCCNSRVIEAIHRSEDDINRKLRRTFYQPQQVTEYIDSFDPIDTPPWSYSPRDFMDLTTDYRAQMNDQLYSRHLKLANYPITSVQQVIMNAQPTSITGEAVGTGAGVVLQFTLANNPIVYGSEIIYVAGLSVTNYTMDYNTGIITFSGAPTGAITADYTYCTGAVIVTAPNYLVRNEAGMLLLKQTMSQIKHMPFVCAITYTYGFYEVPGVIEHLCSMSAMVDIMMSSLMGAPQQQDVIKSNINFVNREIASLYDAMGRTMDVTRI